jgi:hypothetical protein
MARFVAHGAHSNTLHLTPSNQKPVIGDEIEFPGPPMPPGYLPEHGPSLGTVTRENDDGSITVRYGLNSAETAFRLASDVIEKERTDRADELKEMRQRVKREDELHKLMVDRGEHTEKTVGGEIAAAGNAQAGRKSDDRTAAAINTDSRAETNRFPGLNDPHKADLNDEGRLVETAGAREIQQRTPQVKQTDANVGDSKGTLEGQPTIEKPQADPEMKPVGQKTVTSEGIASSPDANKAVTSTPGADQEEPQALAGAQMTNQRAAAEKARDEKEGRKPETDRAEAGREGGQQKPEGSEEAKKAGETHKSDPHKAADQKKADEDKHGKK